MMTDTATDTERWTLVKDLVDSISIYPDRLTVQVAGAPPFVVALDEVGLKKGGITVVSEARREPLLTSPVDRKQATEFH